jgi:membrane peptidoglycan carboxypeptidase
MTGPRQFLSLKRALFHIHRDLRKVVEGAHWWLDYGDLTDIEILVILLEDRRFLWHRGVDWKSMLREVFKCLSFQRYGGASTIDMQFVRTRTGFKERTLKRKLYEMLLAFFLQYRLGKRAILRSYLSIVYLGWGIKGIDKAAQAVYDRYTSQLELAELATIAAMMVYPIPKNPTDKWEAKVKRRSEYGLKLFERYAGRYKQRL